MIETTETRQLTLRLPADLHEQIRRAARLQGERESTFIRQACRQALRHEQLEPELASQVR